MPTIINITHHQQTRSNWCWATCSTMITTHYGIPMAQIGFAEGLRTHMGVSELNSKATAQDAGLLIQRLVPGLRLTWSRENMEGMKFAKIKECINGGFLIMAFRDQHAYVICGYDETPTRNVLYIHDPARADGPNATDFAVFSNKWQAYAYVTSTNIDADVRWLHSVD